MCTILPLYLQIPRILAMPFPAKLLLQFGWFIFVALRVDDVLVRAASYTNCVLNDDYCDCGDDELQSNACSMYQSGGRFQCVDARFYKQSIFLSRVGDGICDCCDGSDELYMKAFITCPNVCDEIGPELMSHSTEFANRQSTGIAEKVTILKASKEVLLDLRSGMLKARRLIPKEERLMKNYRTELAAEELLEKLEFERRLKQFRTAFYDHFQDFDIDVLRRLLAAITLLTLEKGVEAILIESDDKYVIDGPDPDDSLAFKLISESSIENQQCDANMVTADIRVDGSILPETDANDLTKVFHQNILIITELITVEKVQLMVQALSLERLKIDSIINILQHALVRLSDDSFNLSDCYQRLDDLFPTGNILGNVPISPVFIERYGHTRKEAEILREKIAASNSMISSLRENADKGNSLEKMDYGPDDMLFSLRDKCFAFQQNEYTYNICIFKEAKQESTLIGVYQKFEIKPIEKANMNRSDGIEFDYGTSKDSIYLIYNNGEICHGTGRHRTTTIKLECSSGEEKISEIHESEICEYEATILTPLGCI